MLFTAGGTWADWVLLAACVGLVAGLSVFLEGGAGALAAVAACAAAGLNTKYTFVPLLILTSAVALVGSLRARRDTRRLAAALALGAFLGAPFFARNLIWTGNPVAPFGGELAPEVSRFTGDGGPGGLLGAYVYNPTMVDESLGASTLLLAMCLLAFGWRARRAHAAALSMGVACLLPAALAVQQHAAARIVAPYIAVGALAGALALHDGRPLVARRIAVLLAWIAIGTQLVFFSAAVKSLHPFDVVARPGGDAGYVRRQRSVFASIEWIDERLPADSRTLVLGIHELYGFRHHVRGAGNFDGPRVAAYLSAPSAAALRARWRNDGFTHVAVYSPGLRIGRVPKRGPGAERRTALSRPAAELLLRTLGEHADELAREADLALYLLRE